MPKKKPVPVVPEGPLMEDVLLKDIRGIEDFKTFVGFHPAGAKAMSHFLLNIKRTSTPTVLMDVMAAWSGLTDTEQDALGEIVSKKQIVYIGIAFCVLKNHSSDTGMIDALRKMFGKHPEEE